MRKEAFSAFDSTVADFLLAAVVAIDVQGSMNFLRRCRSGALPGRGARCFESAWLEDNRYEGR